MPASIGSARKTRRHDTSNDRDIPWRLAVDEIARDVSKLSNDPKLLVIGPAPTPARLDNL
jgi:hypothetical protein